ncbi:cystatin-F isoform X1 [Phocoena sinus]|uniref:cystatin-F isoform X1 n=1 Tax=Phocoena sinus TaxID=42100 RepID=UPI0013C49CFD|nr:cystatin-F isoform X1 [Phocoena sinus]
MRPAGVLLVCGLVLGATGDPSQDFCSQILNSGVKPGFPKTIKTNDPDVLRAARHSAESFNNCSNDAFLFRESHISRALVQIVKGLKFMLDLDISRTTCKKTRHSSLDDCSFQTNRTLKQMEKLRQRDHIPCPGPHSWSGLPQDPSPCTLPFCPLQVPANRLTLQPTMRHF